MSPPPLINCHLAGELEYLLPSRRPRPAILSIALASGSDVEDIERIVECLIKHLADALARGERIELRDFGVFEHKHQTRRIDHLHKKPLPDRTVVVFKPGKRMRALASDLVSAGGPVAGGLKRPFKRPLKPIPPNA